MSLVHVVIVFTGETGIVGQPVGDAFDAVLFHNSMVLLRYLILIKVRGSKDNTYFAIFLPRLILIYSCFQAW